MSSSSKPSSNPPPVNTHTLAANSSTSPSPSRIIKRKRENHDGQESTIAKPAKRKKAKKAKRDDNEDLDLEFGVNLAIGRLDSRLLADYVARRTKRFFPNLSLVELGDLHIQEKAFHDASGWNEQRNLSNLPSFLDRHSSRAGTNKTLSMASKLTGAPHTLVVTSAGLRAADITRAMRTFQTKDATVAKLFAKHIKLQEAIEYVKKTRMGIGVGTPSRVIDLLDAGALSASKLERVIVDASHIDEKKRGIFDMRETQQALMHLLNRSDFKDRYGSGSGEIQLIVY